MYGIEIEGEEAQETPLKAERTLYIMVQQLLDCCGAYGSSRRSTCNCASNRLVRLFPKIRFIITEEA